MRDDKLHTAAARAHLQVKKLKNTALLEVAMSKKCTSLPCGAAKHISKSKCTKHSRFGALLEVEMSKKRTPLWRSTFRSPKCTKHRRFGALFEVEMSKNCTPLRREARFQIKMLISPHVRTTLGRSNAVSRGRRKGFCTLSKFSCQKSAKRVGFVAASTTITTTLHSTTATTTIRTTTTTTLHYTTLHCTPLHYTNYN